MLLSLLSFLTLPVVQSGFAFTRTKFVSLGVIETILRPDKATIICLNNRKTDFMLTGTVQLLNPSPHSHHSRSSSSPASTV